MSRRSDLIALHADPLSSKIVEIGALDAPTFDPHGYDLTIIDYTTKEGLIRDNPRNPRYTDKSLFHVDYAIADSNYISIGRTYDIAIANHVIEHIPDVLGWLGSIRSILTTGAMLFLSVPDRRYTFDYLRSETRFSTLFEAYAERQSKPRWNQIFDHFYYFRPINARMAWSGEGFEEALKAPRLSVAEAIAKANLLSAAPFVSVHCTVHTVDTFTDLLNLSIDAGLLEYNLESIYGVERNSNEFNVILRAV